MAKTVAKKPNSKDKERLITILREDFQFDVVKEMVDLYHKIKRSRMKHADKFAFEFKILSKIWEFSLPKLKVEEHLGDHGDKILFNIMIGSGPNDQPKLSGSGANAVQIPTTLDPSGNHVIQIPSK